MITMIRISLLALLVVGISGIMVTGSTFNSTPILPAYSTPAQESSGEAVGQQDEATDEPTEDEPTVDQPVDDEPETEPETEPEPLVAEPVNETTPISVTEKEQEQKQLTLDIISSNGLVVVNETAPAVDGVGSDSGTGNVGATEKEVTCVKNAQGQVFCYETLPTDEHCLKPMVEEDPPLCLKGS
jgi:outer membrane biosynthesis protein TonB